MLIKAENFDLTNGSNVVRILCGLFFFPHVAWKFIGWTGTVGFFAKAGFQPPELWVYSAAFFETVAAVALVLGIYTRWTALLGAFVLFVAAAALFKVGGFKWLWNLGGFEYPVFWALACVAVALNAWKDARVATSDTRHPGKVVLTPAE
jgi:putative oxidoreductase